MKKKLTISGLQVKSFVTSDIVAARGGDTGQNGTCAGATACGLECWPEGDTYGTHCTLTTSGQSAVTCDYESICCTSFC